MRRLHQPGILAAALCAAAAIACDVESSSEPPAAQLQLILLADTETGPRTTDLDLHWPRHIVRWRGDSLVIVDGGNSRLRIVPGDFQGGRTIGREGAGPGEFKRPDFLIANDLGFWVSDPGNGRVTRVRADGTFGPTTSLPARPVTPDFAVVGDTVIVIPSPDPSWLLARIRGDSTIPFVPRAREATERPHVALASLSDTLLVAVDNSSGLLYVIDLYTESRDTFRLPAAVMRETAEREARFAETAPPGMQAYFPLVTSIAVDPDGSRALLLRPANYTTAGVLFEIEGGVMTRVLTRVEDLKLKPGIRSAVLEGEIVTMLYDDRIRTFELSRASQ